MSTITAILEADPDGTLHLPLPAELRHGKVEVTATMKAAGATEPAETANQLAKRKQAMEALKRLRARGTFREITDPASWQREIRKDRPLPGRGE